VFAGDGEVDGEDDLVAALAFFISAATAVDETAPSSESSCNLLPALVASSDRDI
jgi:hypothetical protein